jgi:hypothetical protein
MGKEKIALGGSSSDTTRVNIIYLDRQIKTKQNKPLFQVYENPTIDNNPGSNRPLNAAVSAPISESINSSDYKWKDGGKSCATDIIEYNTEKKITSSSVTVEDHMKR